MRTLFVIDAFAQIFRAYYAIRGGMRSPITGEPTHVTFGLTGMMLKLLGQTRPDFVAVASDSPGKTFRDEMYSDYKATRRAVPEDLTAQIPRVFELFEAFGFPVLREDGLEADDVIASLTERVLADPTLADLEICIVSKDKDLEQLLCDRVVMFDAQTDARFGPAELLAAKGIAPHQVIDLLALTGDTVDNVPGVEGIGPKTAAQLINEFGSIDGIFENLGSIKGKRRENLERARETLPLSRALVTLRRDAQVTFDLEHARVGRPPVERLVALFRQLGFNRFQEDVRKLGGAQPTLLDAMEAPEAAKTAPAGDHEPAKAEAGDAVLLDSAATGGAEYRAVTDEAGLLALAETLKRQRLVATDTETTGLERDARLCGLSFAWEEGRGVYVPVLSPEPHLHLTLDRVLQVLGPILSDPEIGKCGHNLKFDARVLLRHGVRLRGVVFDSMLASTLIDPGQAGHKLDLLAERLLRYRMIPITELIGTGPEQGSMAGVPLDRLVPYAAEDADIALRLHRVLQPRLEEMEMDALLREVEAPLSVVLAEMEAAGIICDPIELKRQGEELAGRVSELRREVLSLAGVEFHLDSPKQLGEVLFDQLGFPVVKKTKTGRSTDIEVLEKLAAQEDRSRPHTAIPRLIIEYRGLQKLISTYLGNLAEAVQPDTGRVHTTFHQLVTATGRLASHGPNLQNIPVRTEVGRQIRKAFPAPPGHQLICADYSQIELRILAHLSEDPALVRAFENDEDIHAAVASRVFGVPPDAVTREQRGHAKTINFGIIYGVTPYGLARRIEGMDVETASKLIGDYKAQFPGIDVFLQECVRQALDHGYVRTLLRRRRAIPEIQARSASERALGERLAINTVVQGSAADLIKLAMVNVQKRIDRDGLPLKLLLQIHDELVFEAPEAEATALAEIVRGEMEQAMSLRIPLRAEAGIGPDWMSAK